MVSFSARRAGFGSQDPRPKPGNKVIAGSDFTNGSWLNFFTSTTVDKVIPNTTSTNNHYTTQNNIGPTTSTSWTGRVRAKAGGYSLLAFLIRNNGSYTKSFDVGFDLINGSVFDSSGTVYTGTSRIKRLGNGWYLCDVTITLVDANSTHGIDLRIYRSAAEGRVTYSGDNASGVYLRGCEFFAS